MKGVDPMENQQFFYNSTEKRKLERETLSVPDIAEILGIGKESAYQLAKENHFPVLHIGKKIVIPKEPFHEWLNKICKTIKL